MKFPPNARNADYAAKQQDNFALPPRFPFFSGLGCTFCTIALMKGKIARFILHILQDTERATRDEGLITISAPLPKSGKEKSP
jgi:hypothetical protein